MPSWCLLCLLLLFVPAAGQPQFDVEYVEAIKPLHYVAYRTSGAIAIDGNLDEPSWQRADWTAAFVDIEGQRKPLPRYATRAKMLWDDEFLYIAADLEEPHVWATYDRRDVTIYHENDFEVFIDPDGDTHNYYEFEINALGTEWDLLLIKPYRDGGPYLSGWDIGGLQTAVQVWGSINDPRDEDQGWSVEMAFPWSALREAARRTTPPADGDQWRINFSRVQWAVEYDSGTYSKVEGSSPDNWVWSPQGLVNMHFPEKWGFLQFSTQVVGRGEAVFVESPVVEAERLLRSIYYRQRDFRRQHGHFTTSLDSLGLDHRLLRHFLWPPVVQVSDHQYEAQLEEVVDLDEDGQISRWLIRQDSRVWRD